LIVESTPFPDGRYKIVLLGTRRFRILEEIARPSGRLYRSARIEPIEDRVDPAEANRLAALRSRTIELLSELISRAAPRTLIASDLFASADDGALVNALCQALDLLPAEKQALLEEDGAAARYVRLASLLEFRLAERGAGLQPSSRSVH
jgi:Lon protease-like protein